MGTGRAVTDRPNSPAARNAPGDAIAHFEPEQLGLATFELDDRPDRSRSRNGRLVERMRARCDLRDPSVLADEHDVELDVRILHPDAFAAVDEQHAFILRQIAHEHQSLLLARVGVRDPYVEGVPLPSAYDLERRARECREVLDRLLRGFGAGGER